jgi:hypothetical protein
MAGLIKPAMAHTHVQTRHTSPNCQISSSHELGHRGVYRT